MAHRSRAASENGLTPQRREDLERIVVRLLDISARCEDPAIQHELMRLADDLVKLIEE
jgi:phosphoribosylamine-glycine ligase